VKRKIALAELHQLKGQQREIEGQGGEGELKGGGGEEE